MITWWNYCETRWINNLTNRAEKGQCRPLGEDTFIFLFIYLFIYGSWPHQLLWLLDGFQIEYSELTFYSGAAWMSRMKQWISAQLSSPWGRPPGAKIASNSLSKEEGRKKGCGLKRQRINVRNISQCCAHPFVLVFVLWVWAAERECGTKWKPQPTKGQRHSPMELIRSEAEGQDVDVKCHKKIKLT